MFHTATLTRIPLSRLATRSYVKDSRPRIGVMGGTFDPIHNGHLVAASEVADSLGLDEVVFVPTGLPWHKNAVSSAEHRYLMTVIATAENPSFRVSRVDIDRPGTTYTIDTLEEMKKLHPGAELFFISGADAIAQIFGLEGHRQNLAACHLCCGDAAGSQLGIARNRGGVDFGAGSSGTGNLLFSSSRSGSGPQTDLVFGSGRCGSLHWQAWSLRGKS